MLLEEFRGEAFPIDNKVWVSWDFLTKGLNVKKHTIEVGTIRARQKSNPKNWVNRKDPDDNRKNLILLSSVPPRYNPPDEQEVWDMLHQKKRKKEAKILERSEDSMIHKILSMLPSLSKRDSEIFESYVIESSKIDHETGELVKEKKGTIPRNREKEYKATCQFLLFLVEDEKSLFRYRLSESLKEPKVFRSMVFKASLHYQEIHDIKVRLSKNDNVMLRKIRAYKKEGAESVIPKSFGNNNGRKLHIDDDQMLIKLMSDPRKPTVQDVHKAFNTWRKKNGKEEVGLRTVGTRLEDPEIKTYWYGIHHGMDRWKKEFEHTNITARPSLRNLLWVGDGTKVNYFYKDNRGKATAKLDVYEIVDVHSEMKLGWAFSTNGEDSRLIQKAFKMAIQNANNVLPYQMLYDGDSANKLAFEGAKEVMTAFAAQPYNAQSKIIESIFGRQQRYIMSRNHFFTGQNVKARSERGRLNLDRIKKLGKQLPNLEQVIAVYEQDNLLWNTTPQKRDGKSPLQRFQESKEREEVTTLQELQQMHLFWEWKSRITSNKRASWKEADEVSYRKNGIILQFGQQKFYYEVLGADNNPDMGFLQKHTGKKFKVKYDPDTLDRDKVALFDLDSEKFISFAHTKVALKRAVYDMAEGDRALIDQRLGIRKEQRHAIQEKQEELHHRFGDTEVNWLGLDKNEQAKAENAVLTRQLDWMSNGYEEEFPEQMGETGSQKGDGKTKSTFLDVDAPPSEEKVFSDPIEFDMPTHIVELDEYDEELEQKIKFGEALDKIYHEKLKNNEGKAGLDYEPPLPEDD
ncbi:hypothetical protein [Flammeovirga aprica]|uniref:Integrase catalytic domain-containing protein n=1 Tax=Flammeovirga aprica JL-4 TaxID=694437 RepID=A0A7X9RUM8_9BACT|nr:hypothetical protein [Flammeovirga aprica]NME69036.1 hypothetical protein [Flammeovirga aprica JL-4]